MKQSSQEDQEIKRLTVRLPKQLHRQARIRSAMTGRPISDVIREALRQWVNQDHPESSGRTDGGRAGEV
jgi:plasmid stability protein